MSVEELVRKSKDASTKLCGSSLVTRNSFLTKLRLKLDQKRSEIKDCNKIDINNSVKGDVSAQLIKRLKVDDSKIDSLMKGLKELEKLDDPLNKNTLEKELDEGLELYRVTCPIGLLCIIFESRPEAVIQISSLAIKSGNSVVLKGGKEAEESNTILVKLIGECLEDVGLSSDCVSLIKTREEVKTILSLDTLIDLVIPRGSNSLVRYIQENTLIPVLGHADGVCHVYVDESSTLETAVKVCVDAKTEYPAVCNACETILVHKGISEEFLQLLAKKFESKKVVVNADPSCIKMMKEIGYDKELLNLLYKNPSDINTREKALGVFKKEYLDFEVSLVQVEDLDEAIKHINAFGSHHTDCIVAEDMQKSDKFCVEVDSAAVFVNCSTRFCDGFRFGFGAEVGVSTNKLHARGPVGMEGLLTYKYKCIGKGHIVEPYNKKQKTYTHKALK